LLCLRNARAFPLLPAALASVPFGFVLVRVQKPVSGDSSSSYARKQHRRGLDYSHVENKNKIYVFSLFPSFQESRRDHGNEAL
jgi:hypothetical protein